MHSGYSKDLAIRYSKSLHKFNDTEQFVFEVLDAVGLTGKSVLDVGCGNGIHLIEMAKRGAGRLTGVDVSPTMVKLARETTINVGATIYECDAQDMPIDSESHDLVFSNFVLHYFKDLERILSEIARVLRPDGDILLTLNLTSVHLGYEFLYNTSMPVLLGEEESVKVFNLVQSRDKFLQAISQSGLTIICESKLKIPRAVVDPKYKYYKYIKKDAVLFHLRKIHFDRKKHNS